MPDEEGKPLAGEWWETRQGGRAYVAASLQNAGQVPYSGHSELTGWSMAGGSISGRSWSREGQWIAGCDGAQDLVKHLPDCTGWEWQASDWAPLDPVNYGWHVLRANVDQCRHVNEEAWLPVAFLDGKTVLEKKGNWEFRCLRKDLPQKPPEPKPDPGEGFRLLEPEEKVIQGDEYWEPKGTPRWEKSNNWRYRNGEQSPELTYRRRIATPGPTTWHTTNEDKVLIWGAIHNMQAAIGRIEAQLRADDSRDKFFESGL